MKLIHKDCFLGESIKYRPENPREIPYRLYPGESLSSGQILLSENEQFELRLNNQGGLVSWERESDSLVYP